MAAYSEDYFKKSLALLIITCRQYLKNTADWLHRQTTKVSLKTSKNKSIRITFCIIQKKYKTGLQVEVAHFPTRIVVWMYTYINTCMQQFLKFLNATVSAV